MFRQNNILVGILIGSILPALAIVIFHYALKESITMVKPAVPYFIAIALNLLLIRWSHRSNADKISRGIMVSTFLFMILLFLIKVKI